MEVYWDAEWSAWIAVASDGSEIMLSADSESEAQLRAQMLEEDEGVLYDE
jgi:hypothetical protein